MPSILSLQNLYQESLVRELIEKTKSAGITWSSLSATQFQATEIVIGVTPEPNVTWDFFLTRTQIGNLTFKFTLDIKKDGVQHIALEDGPLPKTGRDSVVRDLYEIVELIVLELDFKIKEVLQVIQSFDDAVRQGVNPVK